MQPVDQRVRCMRDIAMHQPREPKARDKDDCTLQGFEYRHRSQASELSVVSCR